METLTAPYLLIATPVLRDPNFGETVVLMGHHDADGALGWVINRVHERPAIEVLAAEHRERVHPQTPLHLGGPVPANALVVLFHQALDGVESLEMAPGLRVSHSPDALPLLFSNPPGPRQVDGRLVAGYAGWGAGQLEREMQDGAWLALPATPDLAFASAVDGLWRACFARLGLNPAQLTVPSGRTH